MSRATVTLQINVAPSDMGYLPEILPHQLRMWGGQVDEILVTVDARQSRAFRNSTGRFAERLTELRRYLEAVASEFSSVRVVEVDYAASAIANVARCFTEFDAVPIKAYDGSPFYAYLYGLFEARNDYVFHTDSDMLYGGASQRWIGEAIELLRDNANVLACYPLGGPPTSGRSFCNRTQTAVWADYIVARREVSVSDLQCVAYKYNEVSTRTFIVDRRRFISGELKIPLVRPKVRKRFKAALNNTPGYLLLEDCLSILVCSRGMSCVSFLGSDNGMWSLHPPYRSARFYAELANLIRRVEAGDVPSGQRGNFDVTDEMIDWSDVRPLPTVWGRLRPQVRFAAFGIGERLVDAGQRVLGKWPGR